MMQTDEAASVISSPPSVAGSPVVHVESFPMLGTGKLDLRRIRELASEHAARLS